MTAHEVLVDGRNTVARGWWQIGEDGRLCQEDGGECAYNALPRAGAEEFREASKILQGLLGVANPDGLFAWNDAIGRTKQEVLDLFDRAIAATAPEPADPFAGERMAEGAVV